MAKVINWAGNMIDPLNITEEDLLQTSLGMQSAHTLSKVNRFWGQTKSQYSVAQHCLSMVEVVRLKYGEDSDLLKWAIAHESYEALTGFDLPSPIKHSEAYRPYREAEERTLELIASMYSMSKPMPKIIKELDKQIMVMEARHLMSNNFDWGQYSDGVEEGVLYKLGANCDEIKRDFLLEWQRIFNWV